MDAKLWLATEWSASVAELTEYPEPEFFNGSAASRVVIRPDEPTGRGVFVAAGAAFTAGSAVGSISVTS